MAKRKSFVEDQKQGDGSRKRWWLSEPEVVAADLSNYCKSLEMAQSRDRYLGMIFEQLATGRAPLSYGISMSGRIVGDMSTALFSPPSKNCVAIAVDVFANKIGKNQPFLEWLPLALDDFETRAACRQSTDYCEQIFNDLDTWPMVAQQFKDGTVQGTGLIWVDGATGSDGKPGRVFLERIHKDECLLDPTAGKKPRNFQFRFFVARDAAIAKFATEANEPDEEKRKIILEKLQEAPGCEQGFYNLDVGYNDTLALCIGFWLPGPDGTPGRRVDCIDDLLLKDQPWEDDLPVSKFTFEPMAGSWFGQGCPEQQLPLQRELDRVSDNIAEQERRFAWCKVMVERSAGVDPDELVGNSIVQYTETAPVFSQGVAPTQELYAERVKLAEDCMGRVGISTNQATGESSEEAISGIAKLADMQIDDVRHVAVGQRLEGAVEQLGKLIIQAAGRFKPKVYSSGKVLPWPKVALDQKLVKCRAFKMSGLPQSIPGRKQALADMRQNGEIDNITYRRATGANDVRSVANVITASEDFALYQLDKMVETGEFQPPIVFQDMKRTLVLAQARVLTEEMNGLPPKRLQLLAQYAAMVGERLQEMPPPAPMPVAGDPMAAGQIDTGAIPQPPM